MASDAYRQIWRQHKRHRGKHGHLPYDEWLELVVQPCHYCGIDPPMRRGKNAVEAHGIDRVDSRTGYVRGNVVACCRGCNSGKNDGTAEEYIERCRRVVQFQSLRRLEESP